MPFTPRLVFVTVPNLEVGQNLAQGVLQKHLAVCVNIVPGIESHYWWEGKVEKSAEVLLLIKSSAEQFEELEKFLQVNHPYDCPEIVTVAISEIRPPYRAWWAAQAWSEPEKS